MGLIPTRGSLQLVSRVTASSFCRRRLPIVMMRSHMAENLRAATTFTEQGHIRVGPEVISDPAFLVTRNMEDFITWTDTSAIRKHVLDYNDIMKNISNILTGLCKLYRCDRDIRVGPEVISDPAFLVTRNMEDFITWTDTSAIRKHVLDYNDIRDDFDIMG